MIYKRIMPLIPLVLLIGPVGWLSGCATPAATKSMVTDNISILQRHPYTVRVRTQGGSDTGTINFSSISFISNDNFARAIEESIVKNGLFTTVIQNNGADYTLTVTLIYVTRPLFGGSFTVDLETAWALVHTASKDIAMRESIKSSFTATMSDAFVGTTRFRLAVEGAARENIRLGLIAISQLPLK